MSVGTRLRLTIDGPELRCGHCGEWWPIDTQSWRVNSLDPRKQKAEWGMCRLCYRERNRLYQALRQLDPAFRESERIRIGKRRLRYYVRRHHPSLLEAYDREKTAEHRAAIRAWHLRKTA